MKEKKGIKERVYLSKKKCCGTHMCHRRCLLIDAKAMATC